MGLFSLVLAVVLSVSVGNFVQFRGGNNKYNGFYSSGESHTKYVQPEQYHNGCPDQTEEWQNWENGASAHIRVKKNSSPVKDWEIELMFDRPVENLEVYNGIVDSKEGKLFKVKPAVWNTRFAPQEETLVKFKATFPVGSVPSVLEGIKINGKYHSCTPSTKSPPKSPVKKAMPKGVRTATHPAWPSKIMGLYILLADDDEDGFESESESWTPELYEWQQEASNVLFFTFIHPGTMEVPPSFQTLAASRGSGKAGSVPANTVIMFAIGGYAYSLEPNPWHWLTSKEAAITMAEEVSQWPSQYGCDGIDLDLEEGAGAKHNAGPNMVHFIRRLRELQPNIIISQPTYGYPQVQAEIDVINDSWDAEGNSNNLADSIGLMVYEGTQALQYVKNYANGAGQWPGFPVKVRAPSNTILLGAKGASRSSDIVKLANAAVSQDLLGIMVWYASVKNGFKYSQTWDASDSEDAISGYKQAMQILNDASGSMVQVPRL